jgi:hypothetical protein
MKFFGDRRDFYFRKKVFLYQHVRIPAMRVPALRGNDSSVPLLCEQCEDVD